jgi:drug/metabolite transporter (DMT)-like permease
LLGLLLTIPGLWLLTSPGTDSWNVGDSWTVVCAVLFALHVILISRYAPGHDTAWLLLSQLAVTAVLALGGAAVLEDAHLRITARLAVAIGITAVLATVGTTWLQLRFQPRVEPTQAALFYATEPVFAAAISWLVVGETLGPVAWLGGALILTGMVLAERGTGRAINPAASSGVSP